MVATSTSVILGIAFMLALTSNAVLQRSTTASKQNVVEPNEVQKNWSSPDLNVKVLLGTGRRGMRTNGSRVVHADAGSKQKQHCDVEMFYDLPSTATYHDAYDMLVDKCETIGMHPHTLCNGIATELFETRLDQGDVGEYFREDKESYFCQSLRRILATHFTWCKDKGIDCHVRDPFAKKTEKDGSNLLEKRAAAIKRLDGVGLEKTLSGKSAG